MTIVVWFRYLCCYVYVRLLDPIVIPTYALLTVLAPLALTDVWWWKKLASHGKTTTATTHNGMDAPPTSTKHPPPASCIPRPRPARSGDSHHTPTVRTAMTCSSWTEAFLRVYRTICDVLLSEESSCWVPKRWFGHFYLVGLLSLSICVACTKGNGGTGMSTSYPSPVVVWLIALHLVRRYMECQYIHVWSTTSRMHLAGYCLGILHYLLLPLVFINIDNMHNPPRSIQSVYAQHRLAIVTLASVSFCLWSQYQQFKHHVILAQLRLRHSPPAKDCGKYDNKTTTILSSSSSQLYELPTGGWFQYVSCPHYLAEILIYVSWTMLQQQVEYHHHHDVFNSSSSIISSTRHYVLLCWVMSNLTVSAITTHRWYLQQYPETYHKLKRHAIFRGIL